MRTIRHALDELGHDTWVLARPTDDTFERPNFVASDGVWAHRQLTVASAGDIPADEYAAWARANDLDAVLFFQNFDHEGIGVLRSNGIRTIGTYMWEGFGPQEAAAVAPLYDRIFAMNHPSQQRYSELGLADVALVRFAAHPDLARRARRPPSAPGTRFVFMAGYLRPRKPLGVVAEAFVRGADSNASLTVKSQIPIRAGDFVRPTVSSELATRYSDHPGGLEALGEMDPRIRFVADDLSEDSFVDQLLEHHIVVGASRWEGLGLHLFEAEALERPLLLNRMEPYIDFVAGGGCALLCDSHVIGRRKFGIDIHEPDLDSLADAFAELSRPEVCAEMVARARSGHVARWTRFVADVEALIA